MLSPLESNRALEDSQRQVDLLVEGQQLAELGVWSWDLPTQVMTWSPELARIWGVSPGSTASYEALIARVHADDVAVFVDAIEHARTSGESRKVEYRVRGADGVSRALEGRIRVVPDSRGLARRLIGTAQDVTERNETAAKLIMADRSALIATLAAGVAHEINNPLAPISANLELIPLELQRLLLAEPSGELGAMLAEIRHGVDRIQRIVRGLTTFSRTTELEQMPLELAPVLELAIDLAGTEIRQRAVLVRDYRDAPPVMANEAQLAQVFVNLLLNAAHAIPERQATSNEIRIVTRTDAARRAVVEIHDTGRGIPHAEQSRIFDPFFTTKAVGVGTGLGLSITRGIVTSLGGTISVASEAGRGSTFWVAFPPAQPAQIEPVPTKATVETGTRRGAVLVVDDEIIFGNSLRRLLSSEHAVTVTTGARQALEILRGGNRYDIVLCDLMMPGMTGAELYAEVVALAPAQAEAMVFMTGGAFTPDSRDFLDKMRGRWFEKPCDVHALRALVRARVH